MKSFKCTVHIFELKSHTILLKNDKKIVACMQFMISLKQALRGIGKLRWIGTFFGFIGFIGFIGFTVFIAITAFTAFTGYTGFAGFTGLLVL